MVKSFGNSKGYKSSAPIILNTTEIFVAICKSESGDVFHWIARFKLPKEQVYCCSSVPLTPSFNSCEDAERHFATWFVTLTQILLPCRFNLDIKIIIASSHQPYLNANPGRVEKLKPNVRIVATPYGYDLKPG